MIACDPATDPVRILEQTIAKEVDTRLTRAQATVMARCQQSVLEEAGVLADSILFEKARLRRDTSGRPSRRLRPHTPEIKILKDSIPVAPLFDSLVQKASFSG